MKPQVIATVLAAASFFAIGATVERSTHRTVATAAVVAPAAHKVAPQRIAEVVTLPEVTVRPSSEDIALANGEPIAVDVEFIGPAIRMNAGRTTGGRPRLSLDMPYYSFGKALPQVSRE